MAIHFGTDGWRAVISEDFTFDNVRRVAQAIAEYFSEIGGVGAQTIVGFDTRFLSDRYAVEVARVLAGNNLIVNLTNADAPTPAVSFAVKDQGAIGGVMITASHNPPRYNGIKLKAANGGSALAEDTKRVEVLLDKGSPFSLNIADLETTIAEGRIARFDPAPAYEEHLKKLIDRQIIDTKPGKVVIDPMHGAGRDYIRDFLVGSGWQVTQIRHDMNPGFGGIHPEPILPHLNALVDAVKESGGAFGVATDGDADRTGAVDEDGCFVSPHVIFALALRYLVEKRGLRGSVVKTVSTTLMIDRICRAYNLPLHETPVGFNHIADLMMKDDVLIGGEESGGISIRGHIPEGDGVLMGLLLLEIVAHAGVPLKELIADLQQKYGPHHYARKDLPLARPVAKKDMVKRLTEGAPGAIGGVRVREVRSNDGVKYLLDDDSWLLIRPSGTEPVLRVYAESPDPALVAELIGYGESVAAGV
ncbi:phosphomannomutase [Thermoflexales bacterium]|nr:phosphomannomutase [Thermoflexales bacterium]